ncbi:MAG TPA: hypothetical protein VIW64_16305 [Pyrinomonadaceae bacterium]|jgi:hypothetical protein
MKQFEATTVYGKIYADRELRRIYRESVEKRRREAAEAAAEAERRPPPDPKRLIAFFQELGVEVSPALFERPDERELARRRLLAMSPAEAWVEEHGLPFNLETCPTSKELPAFVRAERRQLKAARQRFKELGIK